MIYERTVPISLDGILSSNNFRKSQLMKTVVHNWFTIVVHFERMHLLNEINFKVEGVAWFHCGVICLLGVFLWRSDLVSLRGSIVDRQMFNLQLGSIISWADDTQLYIHDYTNNILNNIIFQTMFLGTLCINCDTCLSSYVSVLVPGDIRNDLYLTLERGDFERGGKSVQKNIEVTVYVLYADGEILKVSLKALMRRYDCAS